MGSPPTPLPPFGGEKLDNDLVRLFAKVDSGRVRRLNAYGPAKAGICATMVEISIHNRTDEGERPIPVGFRRPITESTLSMRTSTFSQWDIEARS